MKEDAYAKALEGSDRLRESTIRCAIDAVQLPAGSRGLDAGCGIGSHTLILAEAVSPGGHVTGLDLSSDLLSRARLRAEEACLTDRVSFRKGDINNLPFDDDSFDWFWSVDCAGYAPCEPLPLVTELARVVRPGGSVILLGWTSQQLLPGHPLLEARLNATTAGIAPFTHGSDPERHFLRALGWFEKAGLVNLAARTFQGDLHAPLTDEVRDALQSLIEMRWGDPEPELSAEDGELYRRLCRPGSPGQILDLPDYYAFFTYSLFRGEVAARE